MYNIYYNLTFYTRLFTYIKIYTSYEFSKVKNIFYTKYVCQMHFFKHVINQIEIPSVKVKTCIQCMPMQDFMKIGESWIEIACLAVRKTH